MVDFGGQLFLLLLEIVNSVREITSLDLLATVVFNLMSGLGDILLAKLDEALMLLEVLLFFHDPCLFHLESICVFQLDFGLLSEDL